MIREQRLSQEWEYTQVSGNGEGPNNRMIVDRDIV